MIATSYKDERPCHWLLILWKLFNTNTSIQYKSFVCTQWVGFKTCYLTQIILFNTNHFFANSQIVPSIAM